MPGKQLPNFFTDRRSNGGDCFSASRRPSTDTWNVPRVAADTGIPPRSRVVVPALCPWFPANYSPIIVPPGTMHPVHPRYRKLTPGIENRKTRVQLVRALGPIGNSQLQTNYIRP